MFVSTAEKLGEPALAPPETPLAPDAALPVEDDPLAELPPAADGEDIDLSLLVLLDEELCASVTLASANSAAAVAALKTLSFNIG